MTSQCANLMILLYLCFCYTLNGGTFQWFYHKKTVQIATTAVWKVAKEYRIFRQVSYFTPSLRKTQTLRRRLAAWCSTS